MSSVRWLGQLWYRTCMICTAVSVFPVPGGPTTIVRPGCVPALMASTCIVQMSFMNSNMGHCWGEQWECGRHLWIRAHAASRLMRANFWVSPPGQG